MQNFTSKYPGRVLEKAFSQKASASAGGKMQSRVLYYFQTKNNTKGIILGLYNEDK